MRGARNRHEWSVFLGYSLGKDLLDHKLEEVMHESFVNATSG